MIRLYSNAFLVDCEEFGECIDVSIFNLFHEKVLFFWNWYLADSEDMTEDELNSNGFDDFANFIISK